MRSAFGQAQPRAVARPVEETSPPPIPAPSGREIPYDYVARFVLEGTRGRRQQDVINISIEGAFVERRLRTGSFPNGRRRPRT